MKTNPAAASQRLSRTQQATKHDMQKRNRKTEDNEKELVVRSRCSRKRIMELVSYETTSAMNIEALDSIGFGGPFQVQIAALSILFNRWALEAYDVVTGSFFFFFEADALTVTEEDVQRVYGIPRGKWSVNDAVAHYTGCGMQGAAKVHHLNVGNQVTVPLNDLKDCLGVEEDNKMWKNLAVLYVLAALLRPRSHPDASLRLLPLLGSNITEEVKEYNWCQYIVAHFHRGIEEAANNIKSGTVHVVVNADMHLLMMHEQSPETPAGGELSNTEMGISPPNFSLRVTQLDGTMHPTPVVQLVEKVVNIGAPDAGRPKRILKKSQHTRTPYCVIEAPKRKKRGKRVKPVPKPPRATFNSTKNLLIEYATNHDDDSLLGSEVRSLGFDQELVTDIVDAYSDYLNLRKMEGATNGGGAKRWIFRTALAQEIHCNVGNPEMEDSDYLSNIIEDVGLVDPTGPEMALSNCDFMNNMYEKVLEDANG
ncbi:hypothetical protein LINGRAHAP2_LOCUS7206 [Linum grandiflorum]